MFIIGKVNFYKMEIDVYEKVYLLHFRLTLHHESFSISRSAFLKRFLNITQQSCIRAF